MRVFHGGSKGWASLTHGAIELTFVESCARPGKGIGWFSCHIWRVRGRSN